MVDRASLHPSIGTRATRAGRVLPVLHRIAAKTTAVQLHPRSAARPGEDVTEAHRASAPGLRRLRALPSGAVAAMADRAWPTRLRSSGACSGLDVLRSSAALSPVPHLRARGDRSRPLDAGRLVGKATALLEPLADAVGRHVPAGQAGFADGAPWRTRSSCRRWGPARRRPAGSGPMCGMSGRGTVKRHRRPGTGGRKAAHPKAHPAGFPGWIDGVPAKMYLGLQSVPESLVIRSDARRSRVSRPRTDRPGSRRYRAHQRSGRPRNKGL